jgi:hypothetical protein
MPVDGQDSTRIVDVVGKFTFEIFRWATMEQITTSRILKEKSFTVQLSTLRKQNKVKDYSRLDIIYVHRHYIQIYWDF